MISFTYLINCILLYHCKHILGVLCTPHQIIGGAPPSYAYGSWEIHWKFTECADTMCVKLKMKA